MAGARALALLLLVALVVSAPLGASALTCPQVFSNLMPCVGYLSQGGPLTDRCCNGVRGLASAANSPNDRRTACTCLKTAAASVGGVNYSRAAGLPGMCGVSIPYKIDRGTDCSKVN